MKPSETLKFSIGIAPQNLSSRVYAPRLQTYISGELWWGDALSGTDLQREIDAISWYHEFTFPNGLVARPQAAGIEDHRRIWTHIEQQLDRIDFRGKSVLDLGCWDGYWSFYAERRGAKRVLATDDASQNWAGSAGLMTAKKLLASRINVDLDVSIYDLEKLDERFDIVLCMGIYYHLIDPIQAFAQVRHCCKSGGLAIFEGDVLTGARGSQLHYDLSDHAKPIFVPSRSALEQMLRASYFDIASVNVQSSASWKRIAKTAIVRSLPDGYSPRWTERQLTVCRATEGANPLHAYRPPFGLHRYDTRFGQD